MQTELEETEDTEIQLLGKQKVVCIVAEIR